MAKRPATTFFEFEYKKDKKKIEELGLTYTKQKAGEVKKVEIEDKGKKFIPFLVCPLCCRHQPLKRTGVWRRKQSKSYSPRYAKKRDLKMIEGKKVELRSVKYNPNNETTFGKFDFINSPFISIRQAIGKSDNRADGREGLPEVEIITLKQVKNMSTGDKTKIIPIINAIRDSCFKTLELTEELV